MPQPLDTEDLIDSTTQGGYAFHVTQPSEFRDNIPPVNHPPDRRAWELAHGKPRELQVEQRFITRAQACIDRDHSTIMRKDAINQQTKLDILCQQIWANHNPPLLSTDTVHFDPETKSFWVYPK